MTDRVGLGSVGSSCCQPAVADGPLVIVEATVLVELLLQVLPVLLPVAVERLVVCHEGLDFILGDEQFLVRSAF